MTGRIAAVFGATGNQGSSVLEALLADKTFTPRAITRNASNKAAENLKSRGAEVVKADPADRSSIKKALSGCEVVFAMTPYGGTDKESEEQLGKMMVDVAKEVGVKFYVWSSLPSLKTVTSGKYPDVAHFEDKFAVETYLKHSGLTNASIHLGYFAENMWNLHNLHKAASGSSYELEVPFFKPNQEQFITWIARDEGATVLALFKNYDKRTNEINNKTFGCVSFKMSYGDLAEALQKGLGKPVKFISGKPIGNKELDDMFQVQAEYPWYEDTVVRDDRLVSLGVQFSTMDQLVEEIKEKHL